jgi:hypothetical protein
MTRGYTGQGGPNNRPLRYPMRRVFRLSKDADAMLVEMAAEGNTKVAYLIRKSVMKDIYIYKAEKEKREAAAAALADQLDLIKEGNEDND